MSSFCSVHHPHDLGGIVSPIAVADIPGRCPSADEV
jgi:hypothetical protein